MERICTGVGLAYVRIHSSAAACNPRTPTLSPTLPQLSATPEGRTHRAALNQIGLQEKVAIHPEQHIV